MLYFDHAASAPPFPDVIASVSAAMERYYANPSSIHGAGQQAEQLLQAARKQIAGALGVSAKEIVFTSSGTESNNLAIKGIAFPPRKQRRHVITTQIEHPSVHECCKQLEAYGIDVTYVPVNKDGFVETETIAAAIRPNTVLVSVMHVNNETGVIQPISEIGKMLAGHPRILFHVDAVQSVGHVPLKIKEWHIDLASLSAHKFRGPRGVGILYRREGIRLEPLLCGGGQEQGFRSSTEALPLIVGAAKALRLTHEREPQTNSHLHRLQKHLIRLLDDLPGLQWTCRHDRANISPHIVHFMLPGLKSEVVVHALAEHDIYVSARSACSSGDTRPSRVLLAMGYNEHLARSGIRISLSSEHTMSDVETLAKKLHQVVVRLRSELEER